MASEGCKRENFTEKISQVVTNGYLSLALAIGHKSGLFETLASFNEPKTCEEICTAGGWKQGYVKEWLGAVVSGEIIEVDSTGEKFFLPPHRRAALTQETPGSDNFACHAFGVVTMTKSFEKILKLMKTEDPKDDKQTEKQEDHGHAGQHEKGPEPGHGHQHEDGHGHEGHGHGHGHEHGHGHGDEGGFMEWYKDASADFTGSHLLSGIVPANQGLQELLENGAKILEIGCGKGAASMALGKQFPKTSVVGTEITEDSIKAAQASLEEMPLKNVSFQVANANELPSDWTGRFDHVFAIKVIHHTIPSKALREIHRVLTPGGTFTMIEIDSRQSMLANTKLPHGVWIYTFSLMFFAALEETGEGHHGSHFEHAGGEEGDRIQGFLWSREQIEKAIKRAGFQDFVVTNVPNWLYESMYICKK